MYTEGSSTCHQGKRVFRVLAAHAGGCVCARGSICALEVGWAGLQLSWAQQCPAMAKLLSHFLSSSNFPGGGVFRPGRGGVGAGTRALRGRRWAVVRLWGGPGGAGGGGVLRETEGKTGQESGRAKGREGWGGAGRKHSPWVTSEREEGRHPAGVSPRVQPELAVVPTHLAPQGRGLAGGGSWGRPACQVPCSRQRKGGGQRASQGLCVAGGRVGWGVLCYWGVA